MRHRIALLLFATSFQWAATAAWGQYAITRQSEFIDRNVATRFGMDVMWRGQLKVDRSRGRLSGSTINVSQTDGISIFEIVEGAKPAKDGQPASPGVVLERWTNESVNPFGEVLGKEKAQRKALLRVAELKKAGKDASLVATDVPDIVFIATSDRGIVQLWDAESGENRWTTLVGNPEHLTTPPAANDKYVAVVNGATLYVLNRADGNVAFRRKVQGITVAAPVMSKEFVFALNTSGLMQAFPLNDFKAQPRNYNSHGRATIDPIVTPASVVWPTDRGHFNVGNSVTGGVSYRIETDGSAVAKAGYLAPYFLYLVGTDGYVFCVNENSGNVLWRYPLSEEVVKQPVAIGKSVYIATEENNLYCMNAFTGDIRWVQPGISRFVSRSDPHLYVLDSVGRPVVLDGASGGRIQVMAQFGMDDLVVNTTTDRLFLTTRSGKIQCLRTIGKRYPQIHVGGVEEDAAAGPAKPDPGPAPVDPAPAGGAMPGDPFAPPAAGGGGAAPDPFAPPAAGGGGAAPDPFAPPAGGGAAPDPFAPPAGGGAAPDPFAPPAGGGAAPDPFAP